MFVFALWSSLSLAASPASDSYKPDPAIQTCDQYVTAMVTNMKESHAVATSGAKQALDGKSTYERSLVLSKTSEHLKKTGVLDSECETKLKHAQIAMGNPTKADESVQALGIMQQVQACTADCSQKYKPEDAEMKTCMEACAAAVKPQRAR